MLCPTSFVVTSSLAKLIVCALSAAKGTCGSIFTLLLPLLSLIIVLPSTFIEILLSLIVVATPATTTPYLACILLSLTIIVLPSMFTLILSLLSTVSG